MVLLLRDNHTDRLRRGICTVNGGLVFLKTLTYLERAADQCSSIALLMLASENENIKKPPRLPPEPARRRRRAEYRPPWPPGKNSTWTN